MIARVVGAGLSGLVAAACLRDAGCEVEVIEAAPEPGGLIGTRSTPEGLVERGANAFVWDDTVARWFGRLGLTAQRASASSRRRFIFRDGRVRRWPLTPAESLQMATRVITAIATRQMQPRFDETVAVFGERVAGKAAVQWLLAPALQGIYAAAPTRLSAEAVFARRRGRAVSVAPAGGMGAFIERLHDDLRRRGVTFQFDRKVDAIDRAIPTLIATNAPSAAMLLTPHAPELAAAIRAVGMTSLLTATAFFEPHPSDTLGFGVLFPRGSGVSALGVLFNGVVFEGRSPHRLETWIYGTAGDSKDLPAPGGVDAAIAADRRVLTGRSHAPLATYATHWPTALPFYDSSIISVRRHLVAMPAGVALAGNYMGELGVARLIARAEVAAAALTSPRSSPS